MRIVILIISFLLSNSFNASAQNIPYEIVKSKSKVGFSYFFGSDEIDGSFPNYNATINIDFDDPKNSTINVTLNAASAKAGFAFATQALRSESVLDVKTYPDIRFVSKKLQASGANATVDGLVTVRGITKPLRLKAQFLRAPGTLASERDNLRIKLTGKINRHDFGASGFPNEVGKTLTIKIDASIKRLK